VAGKTDLEARVRAAGFGSHTTSLSSKYDAKNADESWTCVFCKRPSHYKGLGDLFGPYFVSKDVISSAAKRSPTKKQVNERPGSNPTTVSYNASVVTSST
jgi:hypothetical protein